MGKEIIFVFIFLFLCILFSFWFPDSFFVGFGTLFSLTRCLATGFGLKGRNEKGEMKMKRNILAGFAVLALASFSALQAESAPVLDSMSNDLAMVGPVLTGQAAEPFAGDAVEPMAAPADLAFFDAPVKPDTVVKKNVKKFTAVGLDKIPEAVLDTVGARYPEYTVVNSGKNDQQEYALIINTKDGVKKTLVIKDNGEILSDK